MGELVLNRSADVHTGHIEEENYLLLIRIEGGMLIIADSTENKYSTVITSSKGDSTKIRFKQFSEIGSWAVCFLRGTYYQMKFLSFLYYVNFWSI